MNIRQMLEVASAAVSQTLCSEAFLSNLEPGVIFAEEMRPVSGMASISWALSYHADRVSRSVTTTVLGRFRSTSIFHDGYGARLVRPGNVSLGPAGPGIDSISTSLPEIAESDPVEATDRALIHALDRAFTGRDGDQPRHTRAVVVIRGGRVIAERYAPGIHIDTPLLSHSVAKSVINALVGILVREGILRVEQEVISRSWEKPVTIDQLLRMSSGLPLDEGKTAGIIAQRMLFLERDTAAFAERISLVATPGSRWAYSNLSFAVLSRLVRDAVGGTASNVTQFANSELFGPLGMRNVTIEFDGVGSPMGANAVFASARDFARFGLLYLNGGMAGTQRILPEDWVSYSTRPTLDSGYGAGFWLNNLRAKIPVLGVSWGIPGAPDDTFMARGYLGQYIVIVPSEQLVVVRFGVSHGPDDCIESVGQLVHDVLAAPGQ